MTKELENLPSEQLPNDGGYHWHRLVNETNNRLGKIGEHGKRAKIKVTPKPGKPISAQFKNPETGKQVSYGLNLSLNKNNLVKAEELCSLITGQLVAGKFTTDWFYSLVGKEDKVTQPEKRITCGEMLEQYKEYFFRQRKNNKASHGSWNNYYKYLERTFLKYEKQVIDLKIIKEVIECTENNSLNRTFHLCGIVNLLKYFENNDFKSIIKRYKSENKPKPKSKYIPTDQQIFHVYQTGFDPQEKCRNKRWHYRYQQWQFLYSLLAIYGLRVHEAWNIKNWTESVTLKAGEWVGIAELDDETENEDGKYSYHLIESNKVIPDYYNGVSVLALVFSKCYTLCDTLRIY